MYNKDYNNLLIGGICAILFGVILLCYSVRSYSEIKYLNNKIDFDELDNNNRISTSDKYYKYLSIGDFLNQKLEKNKKLPLKNTACAYLDYSQHNMMSLYRLIYKTANDDSSRKSVVEGNLRSYIMMLENYKTCRKYGQYKAEVQNKLDEIEKTDNMIIESRMDAFLNSGKIDTLDDENAEGEGIHPVYENDNMPQSGQNSLKNNNSVNKSDDIVRPYLE